jgi:hypothetical protein
VSGARVDITTANIKVLAHSSDFSADTSRFFEWNCACVTLERARATPTSRDPKGMIGFQTEYLG